MGRNSISDIRKPEILEHFIKVIEEEGIDGASIIKVAKRMGTYPSLINHYFGSRENLILELIDYLIELYNQTYRSKTSQISDPLKRFKVSLDLIFSSEFANLGGPLLYQDLLSLALHNDKVRKSFSKFNDNYRNLLAHDFKEFEKKSPFPLDLVQLVDFVIYLSEGFHLWEFSRSKQQSKAIAKDLKQLILHTIGIIKA